MDCIQSHYDPTFTTPESGFILDTRLFVVYYLPKSDRGSGASIISASGNWERQWDILSSGDIPMGIWKLEASDADESGTRLPNCPM